MQLLAVRTATLMRKIGYQVEAKQQRTECRDEEDVHKVRREVGRVHCGRLCEQQASQSDAAARVCQSPLLCCDRCRYAAMTCARTGTLARN